MTNVNADMKLFIKFLKDHDLYSSHYKQFIKLGTSIQPMKVTDVLKSINCQQQPRQMFCVFYYTGIYTEKLAIMQSLWAYEIAKGILHNTITNLRNIKNLKQVLEHDLGYFPERVFLKYISEDDYLKMLYFCET